MIETKFLKCVILAVLLFCFFNATYVATRNFLSLLRYSNPDLCDFGAACNQLSYRVKELVFVSQNAKFVKVTLKAFWLFFCFTCISKGTHIGAVSFSHGARTQIRFTSNQDVDKVKASVLAIKHHKRGKRIDRGLENCRMELFSVKKGMRSIVPPVLLTITHGRISKRKILDWTPPTFRGSANFFGVWIKVAKIEAGLGRHAIVALSWLNSGTI